MSEEEKETGKITRVVRAEWKEAYEANKAAAAAYAKDSTLPSPCPERGLGIPAWALEALAGKPKEKAE